MEPKASEVLSFWTYEDALQRAIKHYRTTDENAYELPYHASHACSTEAMEASYGGGSDLACAQLVADLVHDGVLSLARRGIDVEEIARKGLAPLLELGLTFDLGPEKQQILDRRYATATEGLATIAE